MLLHITKATNELRDEIYSMRYYGMTPREFGLKVRSHPDSTERMVGKLLVTARNKMRHAPIIFTRFQLAVNFRNTQPIRH